MEEDRQRRLEPAVPCLTTSRQPRAQAAQAIDRHIKDVWEILRLSSNVLKCNKKIHSAQLTCVVLFLAFMGRLGAI